MDISLEKFRPHDFDDYFCLVRDPRVMALITERAASEEEARRDFETLLAQNQLHPRLGHFRVLSDDGGFLGWGRSRSQRRAPTRPNSAT